MTLSKDTYAFLSLLKAGLWNQKVQLPEAGSLDFNAIYQLAENQSVVGLVAAGIELIENYRVPKYDAVPFIGKAISLEQRNLAMNVFVTKLMDRLRGHDIYALLVKGQGIAQCYERPLWRSCGDVDLLLDNENYEKAKKLMLPMALDVQEEYFSFKHIGMTMEGGFLVELHGTLHTRLAKRVDKQIDLVQANAISKKNVRLWVNGDDYVFLPCPDDDVIFLFTHILHHFFIDGIGLKQICDWCRFLWTYHDQLNVGLLETRIRTMGLMSEWRAFAAMIVDYLGMPKDIIPLYSPAKSWSCKASIILNSMLTIGGQDPENERSHIFPKGKIRSATKKLLNLGRKVVVFPVDSIVFLNHFIVNGISLAFTKKSE